MNSVIFCVLLAAGEARSELKLIESGPGSGEKLVSFRVLDSEAVESDFAVFIQSNPGAVLFVHEVTRNTAPLIREMDFLAGLHYVQGLRAGIIFLDADRTQGLDQLRRVGGSLKPILPFYLSADGIEGPGDFALNRNCSLSLVLFRDGKVHKSIGLADVGPQDLGQLKSWVEEVSGPFPADSDAYSRLLIQKVTESTNPDELERTMLVQSRLIHTLQQKLESQSSRAAADGRMARPPRQSTPEAAGQEAQPMTDKEPTAPPDREGRPPEDPVLNQLLRQFIRKTHSSDQIDRIMMEIRQRASQSDVLQNEATEMFKLMLSFPDRYGTEYAQSQARAYLGR